jgi:hypothetical protein
MCSLLRESSQYKKSGMLALVLQRMRNYALPPPRSCTGFRRDDFDSVTRDRYGAFVTEFISAQSERLFYPLGSEMCAREIARPAII